MAVRPIMASVRPAAVLGLLALLGGAQCGIFQGMSADTTKCNEKCTTSFDIRSNPSISNQLRSCQTGCRLLSIIESVNNGGPDPFFGGPGLNQNGKYNDEQKKKDLKGCNDSCVNSYRSESEISACEKGCEFQVPTIKERKEKVQAPLQGFFGTSHSTPIIRTSFPKFMIRIPLFGGSSSPAPAQHSPSGPFSDPFESFFSGSQPKKVVSKDEKEPAKDRAVEEVKPQQSFDDGFGGMFKHMRDMMNKMMGSMTEDLGSIPAGSHGKMVVEKSGPGYHERKTYVINPDGTKTQVSGSKTQTIHLNSNGDSEESGEEKEKEESSEISEITEQIRKDIQKEMKNDMIARMNPLDNFLSNNGNDVEFLDPKSSDSNTVHGYDFGMEEPRMSEGLRPRYFDPATLHKLHMCSHENSANLKWSDWVSCLHMRMGMPRWLTAATISLGIIFVIWLCLVIPNNAPKQKVKMTKAMEAAQSIHVAKMEKCLSGANYLPPPEYKMDFPPAYDDVANLHVAMPAANSTTAEESKETGAKPKEEPKA